MNTLNVEYAAIAKRYLQALNQADHQGIMDLFAVDGQVISPVYGQGLAEEFYRTLFNDTLASETKLVECITDSSSLSMALVFNYKWTLKDGKLVSFDCVDIIHFDKNSKITSLQILYDTQAIRPYLS